ncbi:type I methionyl aminopeptidase [Chengkuizengella axinellae]|uniref:Methionine aminopeptidase n=1 Tax=Chengkuizengella axinellae TaxID=3064388 RepID=A0ABT9IX30_9BACL|nr:type I methionyl aminopeptidase [Chengkuizengella sp. 2205SS18-9]MDP5273921.1 type I methionyl aminopeptidase [Chengkuizengella sp. 2205SS18-9]
MLLSIDSIEDLEGIKKVGRVVALAREEMLRSAKEGMTTKELDLIGLNILNQYGAKSAPNKDYDFPGITCISVNEEVAHGIPSEKVLKKGDLVNIDVSAELDGYYADTGASIVIGSSDESKYKLCQCAEEAMYKGISKAKQGSKVNQIGKEINKVARKSGFQVVKNLAGHGIGKKLHEAPESISNYKNNAENELLTNGLVLAIETFISTGSDYVLEEEDGWTLVTPDGSLVAQYEHTVIVSDDKPVIVTQL